MLQDHVRNTRDEIEAGGGKVFDLEMWEKRFKAVEEKVEEHANMFAAVEEKVEEHANMFAAVEEKVEEHTNMFAAVIPVEYERQEKNELMVSQLVTMIDDKMPRVPKITKWAAIPFAWIVVAVLIIGAAIALHQMSSPGRYFFHLLFGSLIFLFFFQKRSLPQRSSTALVWISLVCFQNGAISPQLLTQQPRVLQPRVLQPRVRVLP